eukprot:TRINITY_DN17122_c0_g2_i1.p1 TRINITY_DN17122_c0_g2~~TRINITY_DN17122_c0_g2_i1.p1  ORF type:complete len:100 (-),score=29.11 TRINITY_DN17122_c0_g2_i1:74-373(-)
MIPDKITAEKADFDYEEVKKQLGDDYTSGVKRVIQVPKDKYPRPMTTSQELGWDLKLVGYTGNFVYPRVQCNETKYADNFISMKRISPFADQQKANRKL